MFIIFLLIPTSLLADYILEPANCTLKKKINVDMKQYKILGACNPQFAYKAITSEDKIGVFLPCNVVVQEHENGMIEVSAVDPIASMVSVQNEGLAPIATEVQQKMKRVIDSL